MAAGAAALAMAATPASASNASEAISVVKAFVAAADRGDRSAYVSYCTADAVGVDHFAPYVFRGPTACGDQWDAFVRWTDRNKIVLDKNEMSEPAFVDAADDRVYAVFPVSASLTRDGKKGTEAGIWAFTLRKEAQGWRIEAWAWSELKLTPAVAPRAR
jgi:ketosteroid isomerase-like protein